MRGGNVSHSEGLATHTDSGGHRGRRMSRGADTISGLLSFASPPRHTAQPREAGAEKEQSGRLGDSGEIRA